MECLTTSRIEWIWACNCICKFPILQANMFNPKQKQQIRPVNHTSSRISNCARFPDVVILIIAFLLVHISSNGQSKRSDSQSPQVRRAVPVAQPTQGSDSEPRLSGGRAEAFPDRGPIRTEEIGAAAEEIKGASGPNTMKALNDKRPIGIRDRLSFTVVEEEAPPRQITVTDSGEVDIPLIGRVSVENRTCKGLAMYIKGLLEKEYYYQATVLIGLDSAGGQVLSKGRFYMEGQVGRIGAYEIPVDETLTISRAIIRAGGFTQYANKKKVRLFRKNHTTGQMEIYDTDMVAVMEKGQTRTDMEIKPEDRIVVSEKFFNF